MTTPVYKPRLTPKIHQDEAVERMLQGNVANFDDQGLGKCKQAYDLAGKLFEANEIDLMVMVSKASLRTNFLVEVAKDAYQLVAKIASGPKSERRGLYRFPSYHILIVSYENVITDTEELSSLFRSCRTLLCLDEAHYIKNPKAKRTEACLELSKLAKRSAIFSGTPVPNSIDDIFTQLRFLGEDVGETVEDFRARFGSLEDFRNFLSARMIRRRKQDLAELNLPGKTLKVVSVKLSAEERRIYDKAASDLLIEFETKIGKRTEIPINGVLAKLTRLAQITSNPGMLIDDYDGPLSKVSALDEIIRQSEVENEKVIIWTGYRQNVRLLLKRYSHLGAVSIYGDMTKDEIDSSVKKFKEDKDCKVLIAIPACAREGFTLTSARRAIYLDRNFSLLDWVQSQDRIHRISQTRECEIIVIDAENTIDEKIDEVLERKDHLQKFLLGDVPEYQGLQNFSKDEVKNLIGGKDVKRHGERTK